MNRIKKEEESLESVMWGIHHILEAKTVFDRIAEQERCKLPVQFRAEENFDLHPAAVPTGGFTPQKTVYYKL